MKRTGSPIIKIAAATSMVVFSLGAAFAGSAAWFNSVSSLAQDVNQMAVESLDGNFSSLKIYNSIFADKNDYYFSKTASQTVEVDSWKDFTLKDYVALTMDTYSPLDPYQPIMMVIEYTDVIQVGSSATLKINATTPINYFVGDTLGDKTGKALAYDNNPLSSIVHSYSFSAPNANYLSNTYSGTYNQQDVYHIAAKKVNQVEGLENFQNKRFVDLTAQNHFSSSVDFFDSSVKSGDYTIKQVIIIIDYYQDALEYIYNEYLGEDVLDGYEFDQGGDHTIRFKCDWKVVL